MTAAVSWATPQTTILDMDTDPVSSGWAVAQGSGSHNVASGILTLNAASFYYLRAPASVWDDVVDAATSFTIETRMKIVSAGTTGSNGVRIWASAASRLWKIDIVDGSVVLGGGCGSVAMDTTADFHVYRLEAGLLTADLFIDDVEVISDCNHGFGTSALHFGDGGAVTSTVSEWDYFSVTTDQPSPGRQVTWTLNNVVFDDGATASGSFIFDANTNQYSDIDLTVANGAGPLWTGDPDPFTYLTETSGVPSPSGTQSFAQFEQSSTPGDCYVGSFDYCSRTLALNFAAPLSSVGGEVDLTSVESLYGPSPFGGSYLRSGVSGKVSAPLLIPVVIDIQPGQAGNFIHTNHDGTGVLNDVIEVGVLGSLISAGDPVDFVVADIDPAMVKFGPAAGAIDPASTPDLAADVDSDGIDDATFEFLTSDAGISCGETEATLTGTTTGGDIFEGTDFIETQCNVGCH